ncbi:MAG: hypothetical protein AABY34_05655 [Pseudomonadota bacterium]
MREEEQQFPEPPRVRRDPRARGALFFQANHHAGIGEERFQNRDGQLPVFAGQQVGAARPGPGEQLRRRDPDGDVRMAEAQRQFGNLNLGNGGNARR